MQDVDVGKIGVLCAHLQRLKLVSMYEDADFAHTYIPVQQLASAFSCLKQLTVVIGPDDTRLRKEDLEHLLLNAHSLQELHFINVQGITDDLLVSALSLHGFSSLRSLQLESCNHITNNSLLQLVNSSNPLSQLMVKQCAMVSYQDYQHLQREVTREHLELSIEWQ
nr:hypothetical protein BaRGS_032176 [Batillaria attramentaria]